MRLRRLFLLFAICGSIVFPIGCEKPRYLHVPLADLEARKPFTARVVNVVIYTNALNNNKAEAIITLKSAGGERIAVGAVKEATNIVEFARTLKEGESYEFPNVWLDFRDK